MADETTVESVASASADATTQTTTAPAPPPSKSILDSLIDFWQGVDVQVINLTLPHQLRQIGILIGLFALAWLATRWLAPRLYSRIRALEGRPKWQRARC